MDMTGLKVESRKMELAPQQITVLGATGSIGQSTLSVIARHPEHYQVFALTAHTQIEPLFSLCLQFRPRYAVLSHEQDAKVLQAQLNQAKMRTEVLVGEIGLIEVAKAPEVNIVMAAIVGAKGMPPTIAAAKAGKKVLLANKETLVMAGQLFMDAVSQGGATLLPIDSEHNAIFQALPHPYLGTAQAGVEKILLTASGGPFRGFKHEQLLHITPEMACKHPNWSMGKKISVDCATLMNKGLELIEAHWLFGVSAKQLDVVIHPQSVIHSMVQYIDGSVLAQMGNPDMRTPIAYALAYPKRIESGVMPLDFFALRQLDFEKPDTQLFPCLALALQALELGGAVPALLNAANEIAVAAFLTHRLRFVEIPLLVEQTIEACHAQHQADSLEALIVADAAARQYAQAWLNNKK
jgi:1-deoxy-D-xylulose-5-phosphate reductoisomerase